jgi:mRNA interferase HicA
MKRRDLLKKLSVIAKDRGHVMTTSEGGEHTRVLFSGIRVTVVPRHTEINEITAMRILKQARGK